MSDSRREQIEKLFEEACSLPPEERKEFLDRQKLDPDVRSEVAKLLEFDQHEGGGLTGNAGDQLLPTLDVPTGPLLNESSNNSAIDHGRFLPGTMLANRYRIVGMLGEGGMGEVYRADDLELGQSVALKFIPERLAQDPRALERFRAEVRLSRQVSHPNVCRVYDIAQIDGQLFLSMEYVDGEDLSQLLKRIGHFNPDRATELARQLCMGLHAAHEKGVLHRDLKPANVMIDGRGKLLITDFGLAEFADNVRHEDIRSGTPAYMSPEQLAGREVTQLSDIYSLGIILHELFTGKPAWEADSMAELLERRSSDERISSQIEDLDPAVERVIEQCLEPDPQKRPHSALSVIASLPGGDPLAAAMGAGEIPSPKLVAAAGDSITFDSRLPRVGLAAVAVGLLILMWLEGETSWVSESNLEKEPGFLCGEVERMLEYEFHYEERPPEKIYGFRWFPDVSPKPISFWYRQRLTEGDRKGFGIRSFWSSSWGKYSWARPDFFYPVMNQSGEIEVIMTGQMKLAYFCRFPDFKSHQQSQVTTSPKWSDWFKPKRTGFYLAADESDVPSIQDGEDDIDILRPAKDVNLMPPVESDAYGVWEGTREDTKVIVLAAAWRGNPIYYRVFNREDVFDEEKDENGIVKEIPKEIPTVYEQSRTREGDNGEDYVVLLIIVAMVFGAILAFHNIRAGRVDRRGGRRLAYYVCAVNLLILISFFRLPTTLVDLYASVMCVGLAIVMFETARTWIWYMAFEPMVRKIWPQILITTSRLLEGRFRDPLVGRDILAGTLICTFIVIAEKLNVVVHELKQLPIEPPALFIPLPVISPWEFLGTAVLAHGTAFFLTVFIVMLLLMARYVFRTERRAIIAAAIILAPLNAIVIGGIFQVTIFVALVNSIAVMFLVVRFGVLALLAFYTCRSLLAVVPFKLMYEGEWYYGSGLSAIGLVFAIAFVGYKLAVAKKNFVAVA